MAVELDKSVRRMATKQVLLRLIVDVDAWNAEYGGDETAREALDSASLMMEDGARIAVKHLECVSIERIL